jgi:hypothetical protein
MRDYTFHAKEVYNARTMQTPRWLAAVPRFFKDAGAWGIASVTATGIFVFVSIYEHLRGNNVSALWFACLTVPLFWVGAYAAWFKKHEALIRLESSRDLPSVFLRFVRARSSDRDQAEFFVQVESEKNAFDVEIISEPIVGTNHKRIIMEWKVPKGPVGKAPVPVTTFCRQYEKNLAHLAGNICLPGQIDTFFELKKGFQNELEVTLTYNDIEGRACPPRKFKITSERDFWGNFEIGIGTIENQAASRT